MTKIYDDYFDFLAAYTNELPPHLDQPDAPQGFVCYVRDHPAFAPYPGREGDTATGWLDVVWASDEAVVIRVTRWNLHDEQLPTDVPGVTVLTPHGPAGRYDQHGSALLLLSREFAILHVKFLTELTALQIDEARDQDERLLSYAQ